MHDALGGFADERRRIGAADQQVTGVQAQRDRRAVKDAAHVVVRLHDGADMRVKAGLHPAVGRTLHEPVEGVEQALPCDLVKHRALVVALGAGCRREHQNTRAGGDEAVERPIDLRDRVVAVVVQHDRNESADRREPVVGQHRRLASRVVGQEAVGPELRGGQPDCAHLCEHPLRRELVTPTGHLTHAPGDRCAGDAVLQCCGH